MTTIFKDRNHLLSECMSSLRDVHESCGGIINDADTYDPNTMDAFDTKTLEVNSKLKILRREIKIYHQNRMEQLESEDELRERAERLEIMLESAKKDWKEMKGIYQVDSEPKFFSYRRREPEYMKKRFQLLQDLEDSIKLLNSKISMGDEDSEDERDSGEDDGRNGPRHGQQRKDNKFEQEGDFIDISDALMKRKAVRKQQDDKMREFNQEMEALKEKNNQINDGLDEGIQLLDNMNKKAERLQNEIDKINKGLDKAQSAASGQVKFVLIALSVLFCVLLLGIGAIVVATTIQPPSG